MEEEEDKLVKCAIKCVTELKRLRTENEHLNKENTKLNEKNKKLKEKIKEKTENETLKIGESNKRPVNDMLQKNTTKELNQTTVNAQHIGLAVICCHTTFERCGSREGAEKDEFLKETLEDYGLKVVSYPNETNEFYEKKLIHHIENELNTIPDNKLFVFVLSTHGDEKIEAGQNGKKVDHYFCTYDAEFKTQDLMTKIAAIGKLKKKLKFFVIQACRSRFDEDDVDGFDFGAVINGSTILIDAKHDRSDTKEEPPKGDTKEEPPKGDTKEEPPIVDTKAEPPKVGMKAEPPKGDTKSNKSEPPDLMVLIPYCDDCIVLFASMPGKYAYRDTEGSVLIRVLKNILDNNQIGDNVSILDVLRRVNSEVGKHILKSTKDEPVYNIKAQSCFVHNITFKVNDLFLVKLSSSAIKK